MKRVLLFLFIILTAIELCFSQNARPDDSYISVLLAINHRGKPITYPDSSFIGNGESSPKTSDSSKKTVYDVKVTVKEVKNRTLECNVRNHKVIVDQPKLFGADDLGPTPPEMLAIAYGSCIVSTMQFLAFQKNLTISDIIVTIEGRIDFAKAMGTGGKKRAGFQEIFARISFNTNMTFQEKKKFISQVLEVGAAIDNVANSTPVRCEIVQ